ncbi:ABC transporter ATP-binding protein [Fictibacillus terranigra]|uniref:ABC transporter ATP-binding protein n=1 Tax=Fictibacillus terranigra TaxID=3058424 RepID=A0ABT8ECK8_9BACL|nr:ABC transporter ATP-binding protein [Fictibacillus sp. CENA-BCM004]MDN4075597.1 ABC transporter ATP-binding protein [Fictibacillus sp. CENA-BCM004]
MSLIFKNVFYSFTQQRQISPLLNDINFAAAAGEFVSIIGKSGTGKSTLLKLACGLDQPSKGEILVQDKPVFPGAAGYMPQKDLLLPWRTVMENLLLAPEIQQQKRQKAEEAKSWLKKVGLWDYRNAFPHELSGGMRQRIAFLRTLLTGKEVLLLDEPFGALDAMTKKEMHQWISSLWKDLNKTILLVTHDLHEAVFLSDRIIVLHPTGETEELEVKLPRPRSAVLTNEMAGLINILESRITNEQHETII